MVYDLNTPEPSTPKPPTSSILNQKPYTLEWSSRNLRRLLLVLNTPPGAAAPTAASDFSWQADGAGRLLALRVQGLRLKASFRHRDCHNAPRACKKGWGVCTETRQTLLVVQTYNAHREKHTMQRKLRLELSLECSTNMPELSKQPAASMQTLSALVPCQPWCTPALPCNLL